MSIAAQRFNVFDNDTSLPISDLTSLEYGGVLNAPSPASLGDLTSKFTDITKKLYESKDSLSANLQAKFDSNVLEVKGILGGIRDFSKSAPAAIEDAMRSLFPGNPLAQSIFSQMSEKCRKSAMASNGLGKPYDIAVNCGNKRQTSGNASCTSTSFGDLLNKLTGGSYNNVFKDLNNALKALIGLAAFGYRMNMCGVFNALASGVGFGDKGFLARAGAGVLGILGAGKQALGVFDLASTTMAMGLNIKAELPNAAAYVFSSVAGGGFAKKSLESIGERMLGSAEIFDEGYGTVDALEGNSAALQEIMDTQAASTGFSMDDPKEDASSFMSASLMSDDGSAADAVYSTGALW